MSSIERLNKDERDFLMKISVAVMIKQTVRRLDTGRDVDERLAAKWDVLAPILDKIITETREEIYESRKRVIAMGLRKGK